MILLFVMLLGISTHFRSLKTKTPLTPEPKIDTINKPLENQTGTPKLATVLPFRRFKVKR